jgi:hypothetical protein
MHHGLALMGFVGFLLLYGSLVGCIDLKLRRSLLLLSLLPI